MKTIYLSILLLSFSFTCLQAQEREVSGTVTSSDEGLPLPGVSILIVGSVTGTITDAEGNYKLSLPSGTTLRFSYIGYRSQV